MVAGKGPSFLGAEPIGDSHDSVPSPMSPAARRPKATPTTAPARLVAVVPEEQLFQRRRLAGEAAQPQLKLAGLRHLTRTTISAETSEAPVGADVEIQTVERRETAESLDQTRQGDG